MSTKPSATARNEAVKRLIAAHRSEFEALNDEEAAKRGVNRRKLHEEEALRTRIAELEAHIAAMERSVV